MITERDREIAREVMNKFVKWSGFWTEEEGIGFVLEGIEKAKNPEGKRMHRCQCCGTWIY